MNGLLLGYKERNLETNVFYTSTMYYDDRKRVVNSNSENHVGGKDRLNINYSFTGEVLKARKVHDKGTTISTITEISEYSYDHLGRKKSYKHGLNGATQNVSVYSYDAIGRLVQKGLKPAGLAQSSKQTGNWNDVGSWLSNNVPTLSDAVTINTGHILTILNGQSGSAGSLTDKGLLFIQTGGQFNVGKVNANTLQNIDFSWHIRGGLKGINLDASGNPVLMGGDLFSMKLGYEDDLTYFDGNIRSQMWISSIDNLSRTYTYRYDGASRIKAGVYSGGKPNENYTLNNVTYDNNGNIKNLIRNGLRTNNTFGIVDNLSYTYQANSNKIQAVNDNSTETASFTDVIGVTDYTYNPDGSLKSDANKSITLFEYNYLKLPKKVTFLDGKTISYQYLASGKKIKETTSTGDVTDYVGNIIYKNTTVYQIGHDEGRCVPKTTGDYTYEYDIKDHLGSLRVSFKDSVGIAKVTQESHTGVFGDILPSLVYTNTPKVDNFDYTEHERLKTFNLGYIDAGARLYDPLVPRFTTIDPLAEMSRRFSPFTYGNNNPIRFIDPDGMDAVDPLEPKSGYGYSDGYSTMDSRNETGSVSHEGSFETTGGGDDKPKVKKSEKPSGTIVAGTMAMAQRTGISAALEGGAGWSFGEGALALGEGTTGVGALVLVGAFLMAHPVDIEADIPITDVGTKTKEPKSITLFRGVNPAYMAQYILARQGIAIPIGGTASPREHSLGNTNSIYTSWSSDPNVAAWRGGVGGVIMKIQMSLGDPRFFPNVFSKYPGEQEFLIIGPVSGAKVLKSWSTGTWNPTQIK
jgi:RHS repeat-associated protein